MSSINVIVINSIMMLLLIYRIPFSQQNWVSCNSGTTNYLKYVNRCNNQIVAVGEKGTIVGSSDCISWSIVPSGTENSLNGICWGNGVHVAVGDSGTIISSSDGLSWTDRNSGIIKNIKFVIWGNGVFIAVPEMDSGSILSSTNGSDWSNQTLDSAKYVQFVAGVYANGQFIIGGNDFSPTGPMSGSIEAFASTDGNSWTRTGFSLASYARLKTLIWGDNEFMACSYNSMPTVPICGLSASPNGYSWSFTTTGPVTTRYPINCNSMCWGGGGYLGIGGNTTIGSTDGVSWQTLQNNIPSPGGIRSLLWDGKRYIGVGDRGIILLSDPDSKIITKKGSRFLNHKVSIVRITSRYIRFQVLSNSPVTVSVLNVNGKLLFSKKRTINRPGLYQQLFEKQLNSGSYIICIQAAYQKISIKTLIYE